MNYNMSHFKHCPLEHKKFIKKMNLWEKECGAEYTAEPQEHIFKDMLKFYGFTPFNFSEDKEHTKEFFFHPIGFVVEASYYNGNLSRGNIHYIAASIADHDNEAKRNAFIHIGASGGHCVTRFGIVCSQGSVYFGSNCGYFNEQIKKIMSKAYVLEQVPVEGLGNISFCYFRLAKDIQPILDSVDKLPAPVQYYINKDEYKKCVQIEHALIKSGKNKVTAQRTWLLSIMDETNYFYKMQEEKKNEPSDLGNNDNQGKIGKIKKTTI